MKSSSMLQHSSVLVAFLLGHAAAHSVAEEQHKLQGRAEQHSPDGTITCGTFASASKDTAPQMIGDLQKGGKLQNKEYTIASGHCRRVHCWATTGIYVCNDHPNELKINGPGIYDSLAIIWDNCCRDDYTHNMYNYGIAGQKFVRGDGKDYNVVLAYGHCGHSSDVKPSLEGGWDVNPVCKGGYNPNWEIDY